MPKRQQPALVRFVKFRQLTIQIYIMDFNFSIAMVFFVLPFFHTIFCIMVQPNSWSCLDTVKDLMGLSRSTNTKITPLATKVILHVQFGLSIIYNFIINIESDSQIRKRTRTNTKPFIVTQETEGVAQSLKSYPHLSIT